MKSIEKKAEWMNLSGRQLGNHIKDGHLPLFDIEKVGETTTRMSGYLEPDTEYTQAVPKNTKWMRTVGNSTVMVSQPERKKPWLADITAVGNEPVYTIIEAGWSHSYF